MGIILIWGEDIDLEKWNENVEGRFGVEIWENGK